MNEKRKTLNDGDVGNIFATINILLSMIIDSDVDISDYQTTIEDDFAQIIQRMISLETKWYGVIFD